jgi:hypothetical protein
VSFKGVQGGLFSKDILARWKSCEKYILVDLWQQQERYDDTANVRHSRARLSCVVARVSF